MKEKDKVMLLDELRAEDDRVFSVGDTLDVKASIWLVVVTFLAGQTAYFLSKGLSPCIHDAQVFSAALLGVAGILTLVELRPRDYDFFSPSNGVIEARMDQLRAHYEGSPEADDLVGRAFIEDRIGWTKDAISKNQAINKAKSRLVDYSFWLTVLAATINLLTLVSFFRHPS